MKWWFVGKWGMRRNNTPFSFSQFHRSLRSDAALEAIAKASEHKVPNIVLYNYPSFSGAFSALFAHLFHTRHKLPSLTLPFSSVPSLAFRFFILQLTIFCFFYLFIYFLMGCFKS
jgi:hypothetical protein